MVDVTGVGTWSEMALTPTVGNVDGHVVGARTVLRVRPRAVRSAGRVVNDTLSPASGAVVRAMSPVPTTVPRVSSSASPATSDALGACTIHRLTADGSVEVAVPLPSSQPAVGVAEFRQAPPSRPVSRSRPGGSARLREVGKSVPEGEKVTSKPWASMVPAETVLGASVKLGVIDAEAAAGTAAGSARTARSASSTRRGPRYRTLTASLYLLPGRAGAGLDSIRRRTYKRVVTKW